jgi:hypothetical protein
VVAAVLPRRGRAGAADRGRVSRARRPGAQAPGIVRDELARPHLAQLAGGSRVRGRRLRSAGRRWERAIVAFDAGDHGLALRSTIAAAVRSPRLLRSPATGPAAARMVVRSALRSWGPTRRWVQARPAPRPAERPRRGTGFLS